MKPVNAIIIIFIIFIFCFGFLFYYSKNTKKVPAKLYSGDEPQTENEADNYKNNIDGSDTKKPGENKITAEDEVVELIENQKNRKQNEKQTDEVYSENTYRKDESWQEFLKRLNININDLYPNNPNLDHVDPDVIKAEAEIYFLKHKQ